MKIINSILEDLFVMPKTYVPPKTYVVIDKDSTTSETEVEHVLSSPASPQPSSSSAIQNNTSAQ